MQDSEKKTKHTPVHDGPTTDTPERDLAGLLQDDEYDVLLDEAEIPIRLKKKTSSKKKPASKKKKSRRRRQAKKRRSSSRWSSSGMNSVSGRCLCC